MEECLQARKRELKARIRTQSEKKKEDPSDQCRDGNGALAANVFNVDGVVCNEATWHTDN